jgi:hypothetical protein
VKDSERFAGRESHEYGWHLLAFANFATKLSAIPYIHTEDIAIMCILKRIAKELTKTTGSVF